MASLIAAIDQGTTSTRCVLFNRDGSIVAMGQKEHRQIYPQAAWVEHDPEEIWKNTLEVIAQARIQAQASVADIAAVGITNQRETTLVWNRKTGKAYYNAIVWQDTRTEAMVRHYESEIGSDWFRARTGLPLTTYFSGLKLRWLLDTVPGLRLDAVRGDALFGNVDTYLIWRLSGGVDGGLHLTDVTNASRTQLMHLSSGAWDVEILNALDIPQQMLPDIQPSSRVYGLVKTEPLAGVPIAGDLGDQQAALVGQTCFQEGEAKNTYGTGCFMLLHTGTQIVPSKFGLLTTAAYQFENQPVHYALEGSVAIAGALVQWLRDNLGIIRTSSEVETLAATVSDNGGVYIVPAFSGLYAPYWQSNARGTIVGLTRYAHRGHIARAALEATAFQTKELLDAMEKDAGICLRDLRVDGGMVVNEKLMQFQADVLGAPVIRPKMIETTALGAAYAAGLAVGFWKDTEDVRQNWKMDKSWSCKMSDDQRENLLYFWKKAVQRSLDWVE